MFTVLRALLSCFAQLVFTSDLGRSVVPRIGCAIAQRFVESRSSVLRGGWPPPLFGLASHKLCVCVRPLSSVPLSVCSFVPRWFSVPGFTGLCSYCKRVFGGGSALSSVCLFECSFVARGFSVRPRSLAGVSVARGFSVVHVH